MACVCLEQGKRENISGGTERRHALLEEEKNELGALGNFLRSSCPCPHSS